MADPDLRYTQYLELPYPSADLDPWDDKYIEQMNNLDQQILMAQQRAGLALDAGSYGNFSWNGSDLYINNRCDVLAPRFGGAFYFEATAFLGLSMGDWVYFMAPAGKWDTQGNLVTLSNSNPLPALPQVIPICQNTGGVIQFWLPEASGLK